MSENHPTLRNNKLEIGTYFTWANRLWYVEDLAYDSHDRLIALLEDCNTERLSWTRVELFKNRMKEVKIGSC